MDNPATQLMLRSLTPRECVELHTSPPSDAGTSRGAVPWIYPQFIDEAWDGDAQAFLATLPARARSAVEDHGAAPVEVAVPTGVHDAWRWLASHADPSHNGPWSVLLQELQAHATAACSRCGLAMADEAEADLREALHTVVLSTLPTLRLGFRRTHSTTDPPAALLAKVWDDAERFPVAVRHIATRLHALVADLCAACATLAAQGASRLLRVQCALSDPHNGQRSAIALWLDGGPLAEHAPVWIFKPRPAVADEAWAHFGELARQRGFPGELQPARTLPVAGPRQGHCVAAVPRAASPAVPSKRALEAAGALLFLASWAGVHDLHHENVVYVDDVPVPLDVECILSPRGWDVADPFGLARAVQHSALLGAWRRNPADDERPFVNSGLLAGFLRGDVTKVERAPFEALVQCFERCAAWATALPAEARHALATALGPPLHARVLFRDTAVYAGQLHSASNASSLRSGFAYGVALERLARMRVSGTGVAHDPEVVHAELLQLSNADVPFFEACSGEMVVRFSRFGEAVAPSPITLSRPYEPYLIDQPISQEATQLATRVVASAIDAAFRAAATRPAERPPSTDPPPLEADEAFEQRYRQRIVADALRASDGRVSWLSTRLQHGVQWAATLLDVGYYDGIGGVAHALALCATAEDPHPEDLKALARDASRTTLARCAAELRSGGTHGITSVIEALTGLLGSAEAAALLGDAGTLERVHALSAYLDRTLTSTFFERVPKLDLVLGLAGVAQSGAAMSRATGHVSAWYRRCLEQLALRALAEPEERFDKGGLAHGVTGPALALGAGFVTTGDERCAAAALRLTQWANRRFDAAVANWRDPLGRATHAWCQGVPGIWFGSRWLRSSTTSAALVATDSAWEGAIGEREAQLAAGLAALRAATGALRSHEHVVPNLCCGISAWAACLDDVSRTALGQPEDRSTAHATLRRAKATTLGEQRDLLTPYPSRPDEVIDLGLFGGLSGLVAESAMQRHHRDRGAADPWSFGT